MIVQRQATGVIVLAILTGVFFSPLVDHQSIFLDASSKIYSGYDGPGGHHLKQDQEVHEHAIFNIVVNGSEKDLTNEKFQLQSGKVHLENNQSDIVHKHEEDVNWREFLKTINGSIDQNEDLCLNLDQKRWCGNGKMVLNNKTSPDLSKEISQGDKLLIIIDTDQMNSRIKKYMKQELPPLYSNPKPKGELV